MSGEHPEDGVEAPTSAPEADTRPEPSAHLSPELEEALAEATEAVEGSPAKPSAAEAVTESLITAKRELEGALEQTKKEAAQLRDNWMRAAADLENYRRRAAKERKDIEKFGIEKLLKDFLPVFDDLDRAIGMSASLEGEAAGKQLLDGMKLVHKKFLSTLAKHGVDSFDAAGAAFDPERHEAVQQIHADAPAGSVATELQKGFMIHERLLRPAMVVVSLGPADGESS